MDSSGGLQKRNVSKDWKESNNVNNVEENESSEHEISWLDKDKDEPRLSLMEELLLLVMNPNGYVSVWNDHVSRAIRGCMLVELWMRGKLELEAAGIRRKSLAQRSVIVKNSTPTDDSLLNEALKLMKDGPLYPVPDWISYLSGETWNPFKLKFHMRHVRDRLFKNLAERGILTTCNAPYMGILNHWSHPLKDFGAVKRLKDKVKSSLLERYTNDLRRMDKRTLTLLIAAQYSGCIEGCLDGVSGENERLALKRMQSIDETDFESESRNGNENDLRWAVYHALYDPYLML